MTGAPHPLGVESHPEWEAVRDRWQANANDNEWLSQFVRNPRDIPMDDDHDDFEGPSDVRPSLLTFVLALVLIVASLLACILPAVLK